MSRRGARTVIVAAAGVLFAALVGATSIASPVLAAPPQVVVSPDGDHDPGATITVSNAPTELCTEPDDPMVSIDIVTSTNGLVPGYGPFQTAVVSGQFTREIVLPPDLPPGGYLAKAACFSGASSTPSRTYEPAPFTVRVQTPGAPNVQPDHAVAGTVVQVGSGPARCQPPRGATSPRVRASIVDAGGSTRAEAEGNVQPDGSWVVNLRVTEIDPQVGAVTAVCLARVGAAAPYARYGQTRFTIDAPPIASTTTTVAPSTTAPAPGSTVPATTTTTVAAPATTLGPRPGVPGFEASLPPTPVAEPIVAQPAYTG